MKGLLSLYTPKLPLYFVYMLQQVEYHPKKFHIWYMRIIDERQSIASVMHRQKLVMTRRAQLMVGAGYLVLLLHAVLMWYIFSATSTAAALCAVLAVCVIAPYELEIFYMNTARLARRYIVLPEQKKHVSTATDIFSKHAAIKIAVLGSYGKTTMKEILHSVLAEHFTVAVTPGNMNVTASHAKFARSLSGKEDIIIVEFGEGEPGDIERMARMFSPDYALITGLAPNHLDEYPDLKAVADDLLSIYRFVDTQNVYINADSKMLSEYVSDDMLRYGQQGALEWKASGVTVAVDSLTFTLQHLKQKIAVKSGLLGRHQIGPLSIAAVLGLNLQEPLEAVAAGLKQTAPFEHRMQPRMMNGAWIIDDSYNGNLEGMQAGLRLLRELDAKRRWYITPGLVDQGAETERVHQELGKAIAEAQPDIVVLMRNSVYSIIQHAMEAHGFSGELRIEDDPLDFYMNIEHQIASGDVLLMQNDWTDNYN